MFCFQFERAPLYHGGTAAAAAAQAAAAEEEEEGPYFFVPGKVIHLRRRPMGGASAAGLPLLVHFQVNLSRC